MIGGKRVLAVIPARGGSKRLAGKNLRPFAGSPLIAWTIRAALGARCIDRLILSSEDANIIGVARAYGCEAPFVRPAHLASDTADAMDVVMHAIEAEGEGFDFFVLLQPTSPLRLSADIDACVELCANASSVVAVTALPKPPAFFGSRDKAGRFVQSNFFSGSAAPCLINGAVYVSRVAQLRQTRSFYNEATLAHLMPPERSLDIDDEIDFVMAEALMLAHGPPKTHSNTA
jgi:N-acylneuraminate cytidylyltransferase